MSQSSYNHWHQSHDHDNHTAAVCMHLYVYTDSDLFSGMIHILILAMVTYSGHFCDHNINVMITIVVTLIL